MNKGNDSGCTPLLAACQHKNDISVIKLLIESGADAKTRDQHGCSTLIAAVRRDCSVDHLKDLLKAGADVNCI